MYLYDLDDEPGEVPGAGGRQFHRPDMALRHWLTAGGNRPGARLRQARAEMPWWRQWLAARFDICLFVETTTTRCDAKALAVAMATKREGWVCVVVGGQPWLAADRIDHDVVTMRMAMRCHDVESNHSRWLAGWQQRT